MNLQCLLKIKHQFTGQDAGIPERRVGHDTHARHHVLWNCFVQTPLSESSLLHDLPSATDSQNINCRYSIRWYEDGSSVIPDTDLYL